MDETKYKEYVERMKNADNEDAYPCPNDCEDWHITADDILCEFLSELGYKELVEAYLNIPKWYA